MGEKIRVDIDGNPKLKRQLNVITGVAYALDALPAEGEPNAHLPGMVLARTIVEKVMAEQRMFLSAEVYKAAAKAGADISLAKNLITAFDEAGRPRLEVELYDLADMAEGG
jgi:hypothetical protein